MKRNNEASPRQVVGWTMALFAAAVTMLAATPVALADDEYECEPERFTCSGFYLPSDESIELYGANQAIPLAARIYDGKELMGPTDFDKLAEKVGLEGTELWPVVQVYNGDVPLIDESGYVGDVLYDGTGDATVGDRFFYAYPVNAQNTL